MVKVIDKGNSVLHIYGTEEWNLMVERAKEILSQADDGIITKEEYLSRFPYKGGTK
jgi:hypothetical protein